MIENSSVSIASSSPMGVDNQMCIWQADLRASFNMGYIPCLGQHSVFQGAAYHQLLIVGGGGCHP